MHAQIETGTLVSLEQDCIRLVERISNHEAVSRTLSMELVNLELRWSLSHVGQSFFRHIETVSMGAIPRSTAHRYWQIGVALHNGVNANTNRELQAAGSAIQNGVSVPDVKTAVLEQRISRVDEAARNGGTVRLTLTLEGANEADAAREKVNRQYAMRSSGELLEKPEALTLALQFFNAVPDAAFGAWLEGAGITTEVQS